MTESTVQPMIDADADQMRAHLEHLFGGDLDGCHDGRIELAWTDHKDGRLRHAAIFGTDEIDELVALAIEKNRTPNQNVYIGQALRRPDIPPFGRCKDEDFYALTCFYVDIDDDVIATARESYRHRGCPPTAVIVTGRHPHVRAQMLWRQETPERDPDVCRRQNRALVLALGGDPSVVNPGRVMRLGGSIAWPVKPGRVLERTEFIAFDDGRPRVYLPGQIAKAFPPAEARTSDARTETAVAGKPSQASGPISKTGLNIGAALEGVTVDSCLAAIRAGDRWHDNLVRLTGHWISRGWSDAEILTAAEALTLPGYTVDQTRREVAAMIAPARRKWNIPNPEHEVENDEDLEARPPVIDPRDWAGKPVPVRDWLVEPWIPMNYVTALYGDGGLGKTLLAHQLLTAVATGREWLGMRVKKTRAFGLLCEDLESDLHINQERINTAYWLSYEKLGDLRLWPSVGFDNLLMTFDGRDAAKGRLTAFFARLLDEVVAFDARFVVLDTAADLYGGNENNRNQARQFIANACGRIARKIGGAVLLCAHPSLSGMASGTGSSGSTAWSNTVRSRLYLTYPKTEDDEERDPDLRILTRVKANYARVGETILLRWTDGVLAPVSPEDRTSSDIALQRLILDEIDRAWKEGAPYSDAPQARSRFILAHLPRRIGRSRSEVERAYLALLDSGHLRIEMRDRHTNLRGLKPVRRMDEIAEQCR